MPKFRIEYGVIESIQEGETEEEAILAEIHTAGYLTVEDGAAACNKTPEEFLSAYRAFPITPYR
jgi:hypothetical protein